MSMIRNELKRTLNIGSGEGKTRAEISSYPKLLQSASKGTPGVLSRLAARIVTNEFTSQLEADMRTANSCSARIC